MRTQPALIALCVLMACADAAANRPSPVGAYDLVSIDGQPLPFRYPPDSSAGSVDTTVHRTFVVSAQLRLSASGHRAEYDLLWGDTATYRRDGPIDVHSYRDSVVGHWEDAGSRIRVITDSIAVDGGSLVGVARPDTTYCERPAAAGQPGQAQLRMRGPLGLSPPFSPYDWLFVGE